MNCSLVIHTVRRNKHEKSISHILVFEALRTDKSVNENDDILLIDNYSSS